MKTKTNASTIFSKLKFFLVLFSVFWQSQALFAQSSGVLFFWDTQVGCQEYFNGEDPRGSKEPLFIEQITDGVCIRVCELSTVTYTLSGNLGSTPTTLWTVVGGTITNQDDTTCIINWDTSGVGSVGFTVTTPLGVFTKSLCIEKIIVPVADFTIVALEGSSEVRSYYACANQNINFNNLSSANNGSSVIHYLWDFGDGTYSSAFEPNHTYLEDGDYWVVLTVYNSCNCYSKINRRISIKSKGFDIICPGVVCDGQSATYSLPFEGRELCENINQTNWSIVGGSITNTTSSGEVTVIWDNVGASGFGFLTFTPINCRLECLLPTTIKVPVIQQVGTIVGDSTLCIKEQGIYKLPQWPTTDFNWYIVGNENGDLAEVLLTDQRNEVIVKPLGVDTLTLRCDYQNTLLHCGGFAEFIITSRSVITIEGSSSVCAGSSATYSTQGGQPVTWTLKRSNGTVESSLSNSSSFTYSFLNTGSFVLSVTSNSSCIGAPFNISVSAPITAPNVTGAIVICPDAPYTYSINSPDPNSIYHWSVNNGTALTALTGVNFMVKFDTTTNHQISVYRESVTPASCISIPTVVAVTTIVIPAAIDGDSTVCPNTNGNYLANNSSSSPVSPYLDGDTYNWSLSNPSLGSVTSGQGTGEINVLWNNVTVPTIVILQLEIRKCTVLQTFYKTITITPMPILTVSGTDSLCSGNYGYFTVSADGFTLPSSTIIQWSYGDGATFSSNNTNTSHPYYSTVSNSIVRYVTASYTNTQCNSTVTSEPFAVSILPGPGATASISYGVNNYCQSSDIDTELTAATTPGATLAWYQYPNIALGVSTETYTVTDFGLYYFIATLNGCTSRSNVIAVTVNCPVQNNCTLIPYPVATNISYNDCGILNLYGTTSIPPLSSSFDVYGPTQVTNYTNSTLDVEAGLYQVYYNAVYQCNEGTFAVIKELETVLVPYIPKFNYSILCSDNNSFTIKIFDNSDVYTAVDNVTYNYYYRLHNSSNSNSWIAVGIGVNDILSHSFASGLYDIRMTINGDYLNTPQPECEKIIESIALQSISNSLAIMVTTAPKCYDTAVGFGVLNSLANHSFVWSFDDEAENTLAEPFRVFNNSGPQTVYVEVTNLSGCSVILDESFIVPPKCFNGDVISTPADATVCANDTVLLSYSAGAATECNIGSYQWMDGNTLLVGETNATYIATQAGFYWLKLYSTDNCLLETPSRITPVFKPEASVTLSSAGIFCQYSGMIVNANTSATIIGWTIDGVAVPYTNGLTKFILPLLPPGNYQIGINVIESGCTTTKFHQITIVPLPQVPELFYKVLSCDPYTVKIMVTNAQSSGNYNWSNGEQGSSIIVNHGGPYQVTYSTGGCTNNNQITVPKNPQDYLWIFPSGCISSCAKIPGYLIGPRVPLEHWGWVENNIVEAESHNSFPEPYLAQDSNVYNLTYQTTPGGNNGETCSIKSEPLYFTATRCTDCGIEKLEVKTITLNQTHFCSFTLEITLNNTNSQDLIATIGSVSNDVLITPSVVTLINGLNLVTLTVVPLNNFSGGAVNLFFTSYIDGKPCMNELEVIVPSCGGEEENEKNKINNTFTIPTKIVTLSPNPASEEVTLTYSGLENENMVEIYDLMGRSLTQQNIKNQTGSIIIPLNNYPSGIYVIVVRSERGIITQKKLIVE